MTWAGSRFQFLHQWLRPKPLAILEACSIGLVSALAAVLLKESINWLEGWREYAANLFPAWLVLPAIGLLGGWLSGWLIERLAPEASGSGIPQVKAALAYAPMALDLRVAAVKLVSTTLSLGSGLAIGRQGPTVQVGAALAGQLSRWVETSPAYQRQLVAAGAAAGLAAGFNAPIAGVLFVVEELLQDVSDLTLGTAILAAFVGGVVSRLLGGRGIVPDLGEISTSFSILEIPIFLALGAIAGILGGLFSRSILLSLAANRNRLRDVPLPGRIGLAGAVSGLVIALFPHVLRSSSGLQDFLIVGNGGWQIIAIVLVVQFFLVPIAYGSGAPGGLFAPSLVLGAALGGLVATAAQSLHQSLGLPEALAISSPTVYALTGMGAFFSAVTRGPITAIAIVFEMSADFNLVLPLMLGSVVSYMIADRVFPGSIYKHLLEWGGIQLENQTPADRSWAGLTAADIMQSRVETLASQTTIAEAIEVFSRSHHRGFPVVDKGKLIGIVTQTDLTNAAAKQLAADLPVSQIASLRSITVSPTDPLTHVLHLFDRYRVSRLPVTEGRKLLGIITRADIIRAELDRLKGSASPLGPKPEPSYVVYQTRSPATGAGRLLVPLSNPETADALLRLAGAIAKSRNYELECLQVVTIPRHQPPAETVVDTTANRHLLERAVAQVQSWQIPVHAQVRIGHDIAQTILEAVKERHIDLLLMGWKGTTSTPGRIFGDAVDTAIRQADCDVVLVKLGESLKLDRQQQEVLSARASFAALRKFRQLRRWLLPIAGGPNSEYAIELLPALVSLSWEPEILLCQVFQRSDRFYDTSILEKNVSWLRQELPVSAIAIPLCADSVADAIIDVAQKDCCDAIVVGASREGLLQQVIQGNIPEAIARNSNCTVILVRKALI
jgi:CIC family chloride channel protein